MTGDQGALALNSLGTSQRVGEDRKPGRRGQRTRLIRTSLSTSENTLQGVQCSDFLCSELLYGSPVMPSGRRVHAISLAICRRVRSPVLPNAKKTNSQPTTLTPIYFNRNAARGPMLVHRQAPSISKVMGLRERVFTGSGAAGEAYSFPFEEKIKCEAFQPPPFATILGVTQSPAQTAWNMSCVVVEHRPPTVNEVHCGSGSESI